MCLNSHWKVFALLRNNKLSDYYRMLLKPENMNILPVYIHLRSFPDVGHSVGQRVKIMCVCVCV